LPRPAVARSEYEQVQRPVRSASATPCPGRWVRPGVLLDPDSITLGSSAVVSPAPRGHGNLRPVALRRRLSAP
jgi:hypothetical protein